MVSVYGQTYGAYIVCVTAQANSASAVPGKLWQLATRKRRAREIKREQKKHSIQLVRVAAEVESVSIARKKKFWRVQRQSSRGEPRHACCSVPAADLRTLHTRAACRIED
eukprot:3140995-Pleurochrysis_carterae.AAC.12